MQKEYILKDGGVKLPQEIIELSRIIKDELFIAGGFCRDYFLSKPGGDIDLCGKADMDEVIKAVGNRCKIIPVNRHTGTFYICINGSNYEYTPFRTEEYSGGEHTPHKVTLNASLFDDAKRRDFCCNAVYYSVTNQEFIDFFGGIKDIKDKIIRVVDSERTLKNDGLRILRAVRFAVKLGFFIEERTFKAIIENIGNLKSISGERIFNELDLIGKCNSIMDREYSEKLLRETGALNSIFECGTDDFFVSDFAVNFADFNLGLAVDYCLSFLFKNIFENELSDLSRYEAVINIIEQRIRFFTDRLKCSNSFISELRNTVKGGLKIFNSKDTLLIKLAAADFYTYRENITVLLNILTGKTNDGRTKDYYKNALSEIENNKLCTNADKLKLSGAEIQKLFPDMDIKKTGTVKKALTEFCLINNISNEKHKLIEALNKSFG